MIRAGDNNHFIIVFTRLIHYTVLRKEYRMKRRDLVKILEKAGYKLDRNNKHAIYEKPGERSIQVPNHREINETTALKILQSAKIKL